MHTGGSSRASGKSGSSNVARTPPLNPSIGYARLLSPRAVVFSPITREWCRDSPHHTTPGTVTKLTAIQCMMTVFRLHEPPHTGDIGEYDPERGSFRVLGVRAFRNLDCMSILTLQTSQISGRALSRHHSQVHPHTYNCVGASKGRNMEKERVDRKVVLVDSGVGRFQASFGIRITWPFWRRVVFCLACAR